MTGFSKFNRQVKKISPRQQLMLISLLLAVATFAAYWQVHEFDFINFDDDLYVYENQQVQQGLSMGNLIWAFTSVNASNWHPLTWLSYMLDFQLFGMDSGKYHIVNLFFHIVNTLLLLFVFQKMTGSLWQSAMVAGLFALHPLHVESVAWVSERKDVLSTFFWLLTMWAYLDYVKRRSLLRYMIIVLFFVLGLMSKPMLVTLPFVLLLLDYWPLNRLSFPSSSERFDTERFAVAASLVREKIPLFILVLLSSGMTYYAQQKGGAVATLDGIPLALRIANSMVAYVGYIGKMIYPEQLACLYPFSKMLPWWKAAAAGLVLVAITVMTLWSARKRPYMIVGWLWYLGTLVPVIGIVQVGSQSMADRYTYLPLIGIFIIIAWGIPELVSDLRLKRTGLPVLSVVILFVLWGLTWHQARYWRDSRTLFEHALDVTKNNYVIHNNLGVALGRQGRVDLAIEQYLKSLQIRPGYADAHYNLANAYKNQNRLDQAVSHYLQTLRIEPDHEKAHNNLASALLSMGRTDEAVTHYHQALRLNPDYVDAHYNLGIAYVNTGKIDEAVQQFRAALLLRPSDDNIKNTLNKVLMTKSR